MSKPKKPTVTVINPPQDQKTKEPETIPVSDPILDFKRKRHIMQAQLTTIAPNNMLFNALSIASQELERLQSLSSKGMLSGSDFKKFSILIQALCKLSEESRLNKSQSHLEGKSEIEIKDLVTKAIESLKDE